MTVICRRIHFIFYHLIKKFRNKGLDEKQLALMLNHVETFKTFLFYLINLDQ